MIGVGAMIGQLGGNSETVAAYHAAVGKKIVSAAVDKENDRLRIGLEGGLTLVASDEGQSCCEHRYMSSDDDLGGHIGATLTGLELREGPDEPADYDVHEQQFLVVNTSAGSFTVANHNEHNGYYGGFHIVLRIET